METQSNATPRPRAEFRGYAALRGAQHIIDSHRGAPTPELLRALSTQVREAIDQILTPDPVRSRIEFVLLAIRQSTRVTTVVVFGKPKDNVTVLDNTLYSWAMAEIHRLGAGANPPAGDEE